MNFVYDQSVMHRIGTPPFSVLRATLLLLLVVMNWGLPGCQAQWRCDVPSKPNGVVDQHTVIGWDGTNPYCASLDGKTCWADPSSNCQRKLGQLGVIEGLPPTQVMRVRHFRYRAAGNVQRVMEVLPPEAMHAQVLPVAVAKFVKPCMSQMCGGLCVGCPELIAY
jgi:hypothetical protein